MTDDRISTAFAIGRLMATLDHDAIWLRATGYYNAGHYGRLAYPGTVETLDKIAQIKKQIGEQLHALKDEAND